MFRIDRISEEDEEFGWWYYLGWLKSTVSETLIESAIKFRVLQDFLMEGEINRFDFNSIENRSLTDISIGRFLPDLTPLSIREACNKIIHAKEVSLTWIWDEDDNGKYEFWNGDVHLEGEMRREGWECELYVTEFCIAVERMLSILSESVDWHHIYKYDE
jgi:hypothetical protein